MPNEPNEGEQEVICMQKVDLDEAKEAFAEAVAELKEAEAEKTETELAPISTDPSSPRVHFLLTSRSMILSSYYHYH